ncbi:MAG: phosphonate ABC transporter substrate-binding protein [Cyanobacteria bacterium J06639_1]
MLRRSLFKLGAFALSVAGATAVLGQLATSAQSVSEINFGIISTESQANQKPLWEPFVAAMSEELGIPVNASYATSYAGVIEAMRFNQVQMAWYGGKSYIEAAAKSEAEAFARTIGSEGEKGYFSHLIANKDSEFVEQAKAMGGDKYVLENAGDLTFAFNDPNSTSGFLVPSFYVFAQNGVNPDKIFDRLVFSGSHEATALAVANAQVDVATNNNESLSRLEKTNPEARANIVEIWTSPIIPSDPIAYRKDLPEDLKAQIRDFFYTYDDPAILGPLDWSGFEPAADEDWDVIRELDIARKMREVETNEGLSASARESQMADLKKQLDELRSK